MEMLAKINDSVGRLCALFINANKEAKTPPAKFTPLLRPVSALDAARSALSRRRADSIVARMLPHKARAQED